MVSRNEAISSQKLHDCDLARLRARVNYAVDRKCASLTDTEIESAVDAALQACLDAAARRQQRPVQLSLFEADDATKRTRMEAAVAAIPHASSREAAALELVKSRGANGCTRDELSIEMGLPIQSICPLVRSLAKRGLIASTRMTRPTRNGFPAVVIIAAGVSLEAPK